MEPGHEDREYPDRCDDRQLEQYASMEPGHEDREYDVILLNLVIGSDRLNGARS